MLHFCEICEILGKMSTLSFDKYQFVLFLALYPLYKRQFSTIRPIFGTLRTQLGVQEARETVGYLLRSKHKLGSLL